MTENVDGYKVERNGDYITISFFDIFGEGDSYTFTLKDARKIQRALKELLKRKP